MSHLFSNPKDLMEKMTGKVRTKSSCGEESEELRKADVSKQKGYCRKLGDK
jgi:hypothetical protein